jgi:hypothetical protein
LRSLVGSAVGTAIYRGVHFSITPVAVVFCIRPLACSTAVSAISGAVDAVSAMPPKALSLIVLPLLFVVATAGVAFDATSRVAIFTILCVSFSSPPHCFLLLVRERGFVETKGGGCFRTREVSAVFCAPLVLHCAGFLCHVRKLLAFWYVEQHAPSRSFFYLRLLAIFPSWTSRVRSPSPALVFSTT